MVPEVDIPVTVSIQWKGPDGVMPRADIITIKDATIDGTITTSSLKFSPLRTSDGGKYICIGRVTASSMEVDVENMHNYNFCLTHQRLMAANLAPHVGPDGLCFFSGLLFYSFILRNFTYYSFYPAHYSLIILTTIYSTYYNYQCPKAIQYRTVQTVINTREDKRCK